LACQLPMHVRCRETAAAASGSALNTNPSPGTQQDTDFSGRN
jgi:hypothetical protein